MGDTGSVKTFRDACFNSEDVSGTGSGAELDDATQGTLETTHRSQGPVELVEADAVTQATSTLTEESSDIATSLEQHLMIQHPQLAQQLYLKTSKLSSTTVAVSPTEVVDGN